MKPTLLGDSGFDPLLAVLVSDFPGNVDSIQVDL